MPPTGESQQSLPFDHRLTRAQMEATLKGGGSVLYKNRIIVSPSDLPSEAELAQGDPAAEAAASSSLQAQIAAMQEQLDALKSGTAVPPRIAPGSDPMASPVPHAATVIVPPHPSIVPTHVSGTVQATPAAPVASSQVSGTTAADPKAAERAALLSEPPRAAEPIVEPAKPSKK